MNAQHYPEKRRNVPTGKKSIFTKFAEYGQKASGLGQRVRQLVFGFRRRSTADIDRNSLPVKILYDHRLVQRRRVFKKSGGSQSSIALHALNKARDKVQP